MRTFYEAWNAAGVIRHLPSAELEQGQFLQLPSAKMDTEANRRLPSNDMDGEAFLAVGFTHHRYIIEACKDIAERWYYIRRCAAEFWSVEARLRPP